MSYHEIDIFDDQAKATAKAAEHKAAGRTNVTVTKAPGYESLIVYDNTKGASSVIFDEDAPPALFVVESDG